MENAFTRDQERSLWLHHVVAGRLVLDPDNTLAKARSNIEKYKKIHQSGMVVKWLLEWEKLLVNEIEAVLHVLTSRSVIAAELRQNSPFAGILTVRERQVALKNFRIHWSRKHAV